MRICKGVVSACGLGPLRRPSRNAGGTRRTATRERIQGNLARVPSRRLTAGVRCVDKRRTGARRQRQAPKEIVS